MAASLINSDFKGADRADFLTVLMCGFAAIDWSKFYIAYQI